VEADQVTDPRTRIEGRRSSHWTQYCGI